MNKYIISTCFSGMICLVSVMVQAKPIDCKNAKTLSECTSACDDYIPPEMDFTPPYSKYEKRYEDCLKKAYKTYQFPKYWFSDYSQTDRYRSMFLHNLMHPAVSQGRFSTCEGRNIPMPVLVEEWKNGMIKRMIGISNNKWVDIDLDRASFYKMGTISGNQNKYYEDICIGGDRIYAEPMNIYEDPELKTSTVKGGDLFEFAIEPIVANDISSYHLPVPSTTNYAVSSYGHVLWSGFEREHYAPGTVVIRPGNQAMELKSMANYEYDQTGLPSRVTTFEWITAAQSFKQKSEVCTSFDGTGRLTRIQFCGEDENSSKAIVSFVYEKDNLCPLQMNDENGKPLYKFEYNKENRLTRIYSPTSVLEHDIRLYYQNDMDYTWPIRSLKYQYDRPLSGNPGANNAILKNSVLFNPNHVHALEDHYARPFYVEKRPVTQGEFAKLMGRNPSYFKAEMISGPNNSSSYENRFRSEDLPVETVTWYDALAYANARSKLEGIEECYKLDKCGIKDGWFECGNVIFKGLDCEGYRLPTWEEAKISIADSTDNRHRSAAQNCIKSDKKCYGTYPLTTAEPDENGLYDRRGNVYEWAWDWYGPLEGYCWGDDERDCDVKPNLYNSHGPTTGICRRISGSSFYSSWTDSVCYPPNRGGAQLGFRLVKTLH